MAADDIVEGENGESQKLTFFERTFGKLHPGIKIISIHFNFVLGGVRGSMFVLVGAALGFYLFCFIELKVLVV